MTIISIIDSVEEELLPFTNLDGDFKLMTLAVKQDLEARGYIKKMRSVYGLVQRYQIKTSKKYLYKLLSLEPAIS